METSEQGRVLAEGFSLITAERNHLEDREVGQLLTQIYIDFIDVEDWQASSARHTLLISHLAKVAAHALDAWQTLDPAAAQRYLDTMVQACTNMQAG